MRRLRKEPWRWRIELQAEARSWRPRGGCRGATSRFGCRSEAVEDAVEDAVTAFGVWSGSGGGWRAWGDAAGKRGTGSVSGRRPSVLSVISTEANRIIRSSAETALSR